MTTSLNNLTERLHARLRVGGNQPPEAIPDDAAVELRARLERDYAKLFDQAADLLVGFTQIAEEIDADTAQRITDFIAQQINAWTRDVKTAHAAEKRVFSDLGKVCDDVFLRKIDALTKEVSLVHARFTAYQIAERDRIRAEQEARRREAEEAHRKADEDAARLRAEAAKLAPTNREAAKNVIAQVEEAERRAAVANQVINAPDEKGHIRGDYGSMAYLKETYSFEVENFALVPLKFMLPNEKMIKAAIRSGVREIRGLRIFRTETSVFKR